MPQTILGIDIGSYSIKIAKLTRSFKGFDFINFYERRIQYNELLSPEESTAVTLQGMIDDFNLKWDQAICGYPGHKTSSRLITLPFGSLSKVDETLAFELEGFIPFDLEDLMIDYHLIHSTKDSSDVLAFYTLKGDFGNWLKMLQSSHIDPKIITAEGSEFLNLVCLGMVPPDTPYAILDLGHAKTNLIICEGKKLVMLRSIAIGGKQITERIQKKMNIPFDEAERLKIEMGGMKTDENEMVDDLSRQVSEAIDEVMEEWIVQVRQAFFAYRDKEGKPIEGLYLCGGTSRIPKIDRYLSQKLKQNVTFIDCTAFHFSKLDKVASHRAQMPQGLALALRSVASARMPRINLRQGEFAFKGDVEQLGGTLRYAGVAVAIIFLLGFSYFGIKYYVLSKRVDSLNNQITEMVKQVLPDAVKKSLSPQEALKLLKNEEKRVHDRLQKLSDIKGLIVLDVIKEISSKIPSRKDIKLDVEDLNIKDNRMSLGGSVDSFIAVDKIKTALETSGLMKDIKPGNVRKGVREDEIKFELTMDLVKETK